MFTIYKKVTSPETSPVLGPAKSPDTKPMNPNPTEPDAKPSLALESFSLCNCCSQRSKDPYANANANANNAEIKSTESEYEFNYATHYKCNKTTPRMVWHEFNE